jgi:hypothetical protein
MQGCFLLGSKHGVNYIVSIHQIQNLTCLPFSNMDLVWKNRFKNGGQNKATIQTTYILYIQVPKILEGG